MVSEELYINIIFFLHSGYIPPEAVHRYYESRRRLFNDQQPGRKDKAMATKLSTRKKQLRQDVSINFCSVINDFCFSFIEKERKV